MRRINIAEQLTQLFFLLRGNHQPYKERKWRHGHCYTKPIIGSITHPRSMGTRGYRFTGKGMRPASTYRGARRNADRGASFADFWRNERKKLGLTRSQMDAYRSERQRFIKTLAADGIYVV